MLRDIERKVLRILWNYSIQHRWMPTLKEIRIKTGKHENEIKFILNKLKKAGFIEWDGAFVETIKIIRGWEDEPIQPSISSNNYDNHYL
ncbi:hypothetical protein [Paenibacillus sp. SI8]|uniref:hypothetical protein n=1 Tax=unclassified Paenibacillus TaxID=185978 RepID=UPI00346625BA